MPPTAPHVENVPGSTEGRGRWIPLGCDVVTCDIHKYHVGVGHNVPSFVNSKEDLRRFVQ